jgi:hypothetical protein
MRSFQGEASPATAGLVFVGPEFEHLVVVVVLASLADLEAVGEEGLDHVVDVALGVGRTLVAEREGHVEDHVAGALVPQLELGVVVLHRRGSTFLNMRRVCLLRLKKGEGVSAMRELAETVSRHFTTGQMSSMSEWGRDYLPRICSWCSPRPP